MVSRSQLLEFPNRPHAEREGWVFRRRARRLPFPTTRPMGGTISDCAHFQRSTFVCDGRAVNCHKCRVIG